MKRTKRIKECDFKPFNIIGTNIRLERMISHCIECPALIKEKSNDYYSNGFCSLREVKKYSSSKIPEVCYKIFAQAAKIGGDVVIVNKN